ncbi:MAG: Gfo/Idh/MocA family oxidoreductase [Anaerohalosphaeraceae bacterium]|nr:Gfo/Idh/MocA family oxidoreductase [Anaerohalosphaeraceae bacterium]
MEQAKFKTAVLGLDDRAISFLAPAKECGLFDIVSVADSDMAKAEKISQQYNCTAFDDFRQFTLQNDVDILFVAEPLYRCMEHVKTAISNRTNVLKLVPTAANFNEAGELIKLAQKNKVEYLTACPMRFAPGFERLCDYLKTVDIRQFYFIKAYTCLGNGSCETNSLDKNIDPKLLGGGVLLNNCFELIDEIVLNFSLPQQVYALMTNQTADKKARQYLGEDTMEISMKFANGLIGNFTAAKHFGPAGGVAVPLQIYGPEQNIAVTMNRLAVYDSSNKLIEEHKYPHSPEKCIAEMLIDLGRALLMSDEYKLRYGARHDLAAMAFIESAYLSAKTAMPEGPEKLYEISECDNLPLG